MEEFNLRRESLFNLLEDNSIVLLYSGVSKIASEDSFLPFLGNRHFFYLTGIEQENSVLMMVKTPGEHNCYLFIDEHNELKERWTGKRISLEYAREVSQIENVYVNKNFESMLDMAISPDKHVYGKIEHLYLDLSDEIKIDTNKSTQVLAKELEEKYGLQAQNVYSLITSLRMVKSDLEVANIVEAINVTNLGINELLLNLRPGIVEHELSDRFEFYGKLHGRRRLAFETICATGKDATIMHHPIAQQTETIQPDDLILFDLGYSYGGYSADISRTYPVSGVYEGVRKEIYEAVLTCNKKIIEYVKPGLKISDLQERAKEILKEEAVRRRLIKPDEDISKYYIHNVSHHLGLDTHDASDRNMPLVPGNVITVEPGLYFVELGIGVRIEDDVLVTKDGSLCLSKGIKKEINEVEKLFRTKRQ